MDHNQQLPNQAFVIVPMRGVAQNHGNTNSSNNPAIAIA